MNETTARAYLKRVEYLEREALRLVSIESALQTLRGSSVKSVSLTITTISDDEKNVDLLNQNSTVILLMENQRDALVRQMHRVSVECVALMPMDSGNRDVSLGLATDEH